MRVGVLSDTHGVCDPALAKLFQGVDQILHAGDVGNHGGHSAVLGMLQPTAPVAAVSGNVDDDAAAAAELPAVALIALAGWSVLLVHILESAEAASAIHEHQPDIVVHGHSHSYSERVVGLPGGGRRLLLNPGSAGPARFKLGRSVALLHLPQRGGLAFCLGAHKQQQPQHTATTALSLIPPLQPISFCAGMGAWPTVQRIELAAKAPQRLPEARSSRLSRPLHGKQLESGLPERQSRREAYRSGSQNKRRRV
jgi:putative phosphoesterase